jgi:transcriptional regulator with XRE-family HTH domain
MTMRKDLKPPADVTAVLSTGDAGARVRAVRKAQALRIDDAAALSGVSVDVMSRLENGTNSVRLDKLLAVLNGLGLQLVITPANANVSLSAEQSQHQATSDGQ